MRSRQARGGLPLFLRWATSFGGPVAHLGYSAGVRRAPRLAESAPTRTLSRSANSCGRCQQSGGPRRRPVARRILGALAAPGPLHAAFGPRTGLFAFVVAALGDAAGSAWLHASDLPPWPSSPRRARHAAVPCSRQGAATWPCAAVVALMVPTAGADRRHCTRRVVASRSCAALPSPAIVVAAGREPRRGCCLAAHLLRSADWRRRCWPRDRAISLSPFSTPFYRAGSAGVRRRPLGCRCCRPRSCRPAGSRTRGPCRLRCRTGRAGAPLHLRRLLGRDRRLAGCRFVPGPVFPLVSAGCWRSSVLGAIRAKAVAQSALPE